VKTFSQVVACTGTILFRTDSFVVVSFCHEVGFVSLLRFLTSKGIFGKDSTLSEAGGPEFLGCTPGLPLSWPPLPSS